MIDRLRGRWAVLALATWNIGNGIVADLLRLMRLVAIIALQEASDRAELLAIAREHGWGVITGPLPGQSATPLIFDPGRVRLLKIRRYLLAERQYVGAGAGPPWLKQKWAIGGKFLDLETGRVFWSFSVHYVATQGKPLRRRVARHMSTRLRFLGLRLFRTVFVLGDFNTLAKKAQLAALRIAGWLSNQLGRPPLNSHGRRAIDQVWWEVRPWLRFLRHYAIPTRSDHDAVVVEFAVRPKRSHR